MLLIAGGVGPRAAGDASMACGVVWKGSLAGIKRFSDSNPALRCMLVFPLFESPIGLSKARYTLGSVRYSRNKCNAKETSLFQTGFDFGDSESIT